MSVIVTDTGFKSDDWPEGAVAFAEMEPNGINSLVAVDLPGDTAPEAVEGLAERASHIRVLIPAFSDGRGFTLAKQLRRMGFSGRLRAAGPLIADQYAMARRSGFDEIEIPPALAERQPESDWLARADWQAPHYQRRLQA
ncbi:DUF934 domain-containing protein [Natronohydrobacter thiooxidans]|uniref:DUF934 domain-containing protein n=1 Tax=Natronohydrobacter thiooxidans TaxID=87172 RepID=UPI0008FF04EA|nr:DUF934 domain-containing protein [Natronohydrobacter thiooxidans]